MAYIRNQNSQQLSRKLEDFSHAGLGVVRGGTPEFLALTTRSALIFLLLLKCLVSSCHFIADMNEASFTSG